MSRLKRLGAIAAVGCLAVSAVGASSAQALTVTLNTPGGKSVVAPDAAVPGALNAFGQIVTGPAGDSNPLTVTVGP